MNTLPDPVARYLKASAELDAEGALAPILAGEAHLRSSGLPLQLNV